MSLPAQLEEPHGRHLQGELRFSAQGKARELYFHLVSVNYPCRLNKLLKLETNIIFLHTVLRTSQDLTLLRSFVHLWVFSVLLVHLPVSLSRHGSITNQTLLPCPPSGKPALARNSFPVFGVVSHTVWKPFQAQARCSCDGKACPSAGLAGTAGARSPGELHVVRLGGQEGKLCQDWLRCTTSGCPWTEGIRQMFIV